MTMETVEVVEAVVIGVIVLAALFTFLVYEKGWPCRRRRK